MTHRGWIGLLFLTVMAWGQAAKPPAPATPSKPAPPSPAASAQAADGAGVSRDAAVITIPGLCDKPAPGTAEAADCKTVVTRGEFESLLDAVAPNLPPANRKQLATQYGAALVMVHKAHEMGLDQGPRFQELMRVARVGVLTKELSQSLQAQTQHISDADIAKYYRDHEVAYQEVELQRIFIPRSKPLPEGKDKPGADQAQKLQRESEETMKKLAEALRARAAAGEDLDQLQQEAGAAADLKSKPPTKLGKLRRTSLPPGQSDVFNLKPGETSPLITAPNGYLVYKVGEKDTLPLEKVSDEIASTLRSQRMQDSLQAVQQSAKPELNEQYFAEATPAAPPRTDPGKTGTQAPASPPGSGPK